MNIVLGDASFPAQRVFCVGRNYVDHVRELDNSVPARPVLFMKPASCLVPPGRKLRLPAHGNALHHEAELVLLIGKSGRPSADAAAWDFVAGLSLGLDLTLRDLQTELKREGLPWEMAKAFDDSAPIGRFVPVAAVSDRDRVRFECTVNGRIRQRGDTSLMLFPVPALLAAVGEVWSLTRGDLVFTGTPAGVGPLEAGDDVEVSEPAIGRFAWSVARAC